MVSGMYKVVKKRSYVSDRIYLFDPETEEWMRLPQRLKRQMMGQQVKNECK